jgi:hypothetical protein
VRGVVLGVELGLALGNGAGEAFGGMVLEGLAAMEKATSDDDND